MPGNTFRFLGVPPLVGRTIQPSDIRATGEAEPVVVLSFNLWQRMFDGDPSVVGRTMALSSEPHLIVGVMPPRFGWGAATWPTNDGVWLPLGTTEGDARLRAWVRLREGITEAVAAEQFQALFVQMAQSGPGSLPKQSFYTNFQRFERGVGGTAASVRQMRSSLHFLLYAVGFLLLIACTNVANLQLARGSARSREVAIRLAVGASRGRIARQLLTENIVLALAAGVLGVVLATGLTRLIITLIPQGYVPAESEIATNVPVLLFAIAISLLSGMLFGMFPAVHSSKSDLNETLKDSGVGVGGLRGLRTRNLLVVVEIALSVLLVMGASLAVRGYLTLERQDPGLDPERLLRTGVIFSSRSVVGDRIRLDPGAIDAVVVGILRDPSGEEQPAPTVFLPYTTTLSVSTPMLYVRTRHAGPLRSANVIRAVVLAAGRLQPRFNMALFGALAAIALALAAAGVYAVL